MTKLRKFSNLTWQEQRLLCRAAFLLVLAEVGLRIFPFRDLLNWAQRDSRRNRAVMLTSPERVAWLVEAAARLSWLRSTCLRKALVLYALLKEQDQDARLMIGTTSRRDGFRAHAWVEVDGKSFGAQDQPLYTELASFGSGCSERQTA